MLPRTPRCCRFACALSRCNSGQDGIEIVKLASRALVYVHVPSKTPMFFDTDGRNNLFPTVYALWRVQSAAAGDETCCLPLVVHPPVSKFILNGADVMLPGPGSLAPFLCFLSAGCPRRIRRSLRRDTDSDCHALSFVRGSCASRFAVVLSPKVPGDWISLFPIPLMVYRVFVLFCQAL